MAVIVTSACQPVACAAGRKNSSLWKSASWLRISSGARWFSAVLLAACTMGVGATPPPSIQFLGIPTPVFTSGISFPIGMAEDVAGNVYIAEYNGNAVYKETLQPDGTYIRSTVASGFSYGPVGLAIDVAGNVYVGLDITGGTSRLLKETLQGDGSYIQSYIGTGNGDVYGIAVDGNGNVFAVSSSGTNPTGNVVLKFFPSGSTYTSSVVFTSPSGILAGVALDSSGNVFVAKEYGNTIYKLTPSGDPATTTSYTSSAITLATGTSAFDVALDANGDLFVADTAGKILVEVPVGGGTYTETVLASGLSSPFGVTVGPTGTIYFGVSGAVDKFSPAPVNLGSPNLKTASSVYTLSYTVQPSTVIGAINVVSEGVVNTESGSPEFANAGGGTCTAQTYSALAVCSVKVKFTPQFTGLQTGAVQILDAGGNLLNNVYLYGIGKAPLVGFSAGTAGLLSITGLGATPLSGARHPAIDVAGNLYIADSGNNRIVEVAPGGAASVLNTTGFTLDTPTAVAIDGAGNLYIADSGNGRVVKLSAQGLASVLDTNSLALAANYSVAVDGLGNVYTTDAVNNRVLEFPNLGTAHVLSTTGVTLGSAYGVAADGSGNIYIADKSNSQIVKVSGGTGTVLNFGTLSPALLNPTDVAVDAPGNVYIADSGNNRIVEVSSGTTRAIPLGSGSYSLNAPDCAVVGNAEELYICDSGNNRIVNSNQKTPIALTFATPGTTESISLLNLGNLSLALSVPGSGQNPGFGTSSFQLLNAGSTGFCPQLSSNSSAASLTAGASCELNVEFVPAQGATGTITDSLTITDNDLRVNPSVQTISLSGTALDTPAVTLTPSPASPIVYGQAQTSLGVTVRSTSGTPSGTISFTDNNNSLGNATALTEDAVSLPAQYYVPGSHSFQASYSGDSSFNPATSSAVSYVVNQASSTVSGTSGTVQVAHGIEGSITVNVAGQYSGAGISAPSGSVAYSIADSGSNVAASGRATIASGSATIPVASTLTSALYAVTVNYTGDSNYNAATPVAIGLRIGTIAPSIGWPAPSAITYGAPLSGILNATASSGGTTVAGSFAYTATPTGGSAATVTAASVLNTGNYSLTAVFTPTDPANYSSASASVSLTVSKATTVASWPAPSAIAYGTTLSGILNATASSGGTTVAGSFAYTATPTGGSATPVTAATQLGAGVYALTATFTPTDTEEYVSGETASVSLTVDHAQSVAQLTSGVNPVLVSNPSTLTATISSNAGTPTGTVSFHDGATPLGSHPLSSGIAALTLSNLGVGSHSISVVYSGDANFAASSSTVLTQLVMDFAIVAATGGNGKSSQTILPGGSATFALSIVPTAGAMLPTPAVFTVAGLPQGASAVVSPGTWAPTSATTWTLPANTTLQSVVLTIQLPSTTAQNEKKALFSRDRSPLLWGLLLLPFAARVRRTSRRFGRWMSLLVVICACSFAIVGTTGCGSHNGFFSQPSHTYTVTETVTSGALSHSATVTLTVQ